MSLLEHKDVERLLRSHGWLLDEMREVPPGSPAGARGSFVGASDVEAGVPDGCVHLTAVGVRRTPGQFPARQLELLAGAGGMYVLGVDGRSTPGPEPRVTTTRVTFAKLPA